MTRYRWAAARKAKGFPITAACEPAEVSRQAFRDWKAKVAAGPSAAERAEAELVNEIRSIPGSDPAVDALPPAPAAEGRPGQPPFGTLTTEGVQAHGLPSWSSPAIPSRPSPVILLVSVPLELTRRRRASVEHTEAPAVDACALTAFYRGRVVFSR
ncbi:MAG TPA: hypothetical protein VGV93_02280, partial [Acidimicrobiales bacterium]|nr:hypothetical protein [Acidimicrobiales bacterium]